MGQRNRKDRKVILISQTTELAQEATGDNNFNWAVLIAAVLAFIGAVVTAGISLRNSSQQSRNAVVLQDTQRANQESLKRIEHDLISRQREIDYRRRQLDEFYGRILMLRQVSRSLRDRLPEEDGRGRWRLVHNIEQVKNSPDEQLIKTVERIIEIDTEIQSIMTNKTSLLVEFPQPASFSLFARHAELLRMDWSLGRNQDPENSVPYPDDLDRDLSSGYNTIKHRLDLLLTQDASAS
jgi:hypothetical protein